MKRIPAVAGQFYESAPLKLTGQVEACLQPGQKKEPVTGIVSPHAGLMYSGSVAGAVYSMIRIPQTVILIGPNHTGYGSPVSIMSSGLWEIPTGTVKIDEALAMKLMNHSPVISDVITEDSQAHQMEHSLEVQLPFLLHQSPHVEIVPITLMPVALDICKALGEGVAACIQDSDYPVTIIASSDMSHYETDSEARKKDKLAVDRILALDPEGLYNTVRDKGISMCGVMPVTTMLYAAAELGAQESSLVKYMTSGEVNGDYDSVVGYAGIIVK